MEKKKYKIRLLLDYQCTFLWSGNEETEKKFGYNIELEKLPLEKETIEEIRRLSTVYDTSLDWNNPMGKSPWTNIEEESFFRELKEIISKIKAELGPRFEIQNEIKNSDE